MCALPWSLFTPCVYFSFRLTHRQALQPPPRLCHDCCTVLTLSASFWVTWEPCCQTGLLGLASPAAPAFQAVTYRLLAALPSNNNANVQLPPKHLCDPSHSLFSSLHFASFYCGKLCITLPGAIWYPPFTRNFRDLETVHLCPVTTCTYE